MVISFIAVRTVKEKKIQGVLPGNTDNKMLAQTMGFESNKEYNEIMFLREITHTVNALNDMGDIVRLYSKNPETAKNRLANLLSEKDPDSV